MHLPQKLAQTTQTWWGEDGPRWVAELPARLTDLEAQWDVTLGPPFEPGGCTSYVAPATRTDGNTVVVKVCVPDPESEHESDALRAWDGDGVIRLLEHAPEHHALMLEHCAPGTPLADMPDDHTADTIAAELAPRLWHEPGPEHPYCLLADASAGWAERTRERFDRLRPAIDARAIEHTCQLMEDLPRTTRTHVLLHGDFHPWNILAAEREPWLTVDPKPLVGDPAFEWGRYITNRLDQYLHASPDPATALNDLIGKLAAACGLDTERVRGWTLVREVEGDLWSADVEDPNPRATERIELLLP